MANGVIGFVLGFVVMLYLSIAIDRENAKRGFFSVGGSLYVVTPAELPLRKREARD